MCEIMNEWHLSALTEETCVEPETEQRFVRVEMIHVDVDEVLTVMKEIHVGKAVRSDSVT